MGMETPLLTSDEDPSPPSLSSGPVIAEESEFSRLISRTNNNTISPLQVASDPFAFSSNTNTNNHTTPPRSSQQQQRLLNFIGEQEQGYLNVNAALKRGSLVTVVAGSLCMMHGCFAWSSYMVDSWSDTHLTIVIAWQKQYLPGLDGLTDTVLRSTNLASLLQDLATAQQYLLLAALWCFSLLLPCAFCILSPTWIVGDYNDNYQQLQQSVSLEQRMQDNMRTWSARELFEVTFRFTFLLLFVLSLLDLSTAIELHWTDTVLDVRSRALGGLASYVTAMASAIGVIFVLRFQQGTRCSFTTTTTTTTTTTSTGSEGDLRQKRQAATIRSPPPQAFQHPWRLDGPSMSVLEEAPEPGPHVYRRIPDASSTPELIEENTSSTMTPTRPSKLSFGKKVLVFQVGLLTTVLWIPSLYLPLFRVSYGGLAREFMAVSSLKVFLWQIPTLLWTQGVLAGTPIWILLGVGFVVMTVVIALPVVATCLGISTWLGEPRLSYRSRSWLYCIHPALCGLVFCVALIATVPALQPLGNLLLDEDGTGICDKFQKVVGEPCLNLTGRLLSGAWFFLVQSIVLEMFVVMTLQWT